MRILLVLLISTHFFLLSTPRAFAQQNNPSSIVITVLNMEGKVEFARDGWKTRQVLSPGTMLTLADLVYPTGDSTLLAMCANGIAYKFRLSSSLPNDRLNCAAAPVLIKEQPGGMYIAIQRGVEDETIPYVIEPRASAIRKPNVEVRWNAVQDAQSYIVKIRGGDKLWESNELIAAQVVQGNIGRFQPPYRFQEKVPYTIEICAQFKTVQRCTTDSDWSSAANLTFYYRPAPQMLENAEKQLIDSLRAINLGRDTPESSYARAVLLSQPVEIAANVQLGFYHEAISLLESINKTSSHPLAKSPEVYNLLGKLYQKIGLLRNATSTFEQAARLATSGTEPAAKAALGRAVTAPSCEPNAPSGVRKPGCVSFADLYTEALDHYAKFLKPDSFQKQVAEICDQLGDLRSYVKYCSS